MGLYALPHAALWHLEPNSALDAAWELTANLSFSQLHSLEAWQIMTCQETIWTVLEAWTVLFFFSQESIEYGKTRGSHRSHKIYLPFGLDYNNNMSESPHGTLIWSNCLQKNQSHAFFLKNEGGRRIKKTFIFILLASLIFFYFSLTFRK